jgi:hypothetical protein
VKLSATQTLLTASLAPHHKPLQRSQLLSQIRDNGAVAPGLALHIYANNVSGALTRSLAAAYPACFRVLGESCFQGIAHRFVEDTPSGHPDLNRYGATLGDLLDEWTATRQQFSDYRYLGDLARLEWLCHTAYYAADDMPFDINTFADACRSAPHTLCLQLSHSVGLLQSEYPVMAIRDANLFGGDASEVEAGELPEHLVVSRPSFQTRVERVDSMTFHVLAGCATGHTLGRILENAGEHADKVPGVMQALVRHGWITGVHSGKTGTPGGQ